MKSFGIILLVLCSTMLNVTRGSTEITEILEDAPDVTPEQKNSLQPLFNELQKQYDYINIEAMQNGVPIDKEFVTLYQKSQHEFEQYFERLTSQPKTNFSFSIVYPTVDQLLNISTEKFTIEQTDELFEMLSTLEYVIKETVKDINMTQHLVAEIESSLIEIDKPKVVAYIYNALKKVFYASVRVSRAAYCTYSYIPELNTSLYYIYDATDCTKYTVGLIETIKLEITAAVQTINRNLQDLATIYESVVNKNSLATKIVMIIISIDNIKKDIQSIAAAARNIKDKSTEIPNAANVTKQCATDFIKVLPQIIDTVSNVTTCIIYVDNTTNDYDFMKPESVEVIELK